MNYRTLEMIDRDMRDRDGHLIGTVSELILDPTTGRVAFAVIEVPAASDDDEPRFLPMPWGVLTRSDEGELRTSLPRVRLSGAPRFSAAGLEQLRRRRSGVDIFAYYGLQPPWEQPPADAGDRERRPQAADGVERPQRNADRLERGSRAAVDPGPDGRTGQ